VVGVNKVQTMIPVGAESHRELEDGKTRTGGFCFTNEPNQRIEYLAC
jgi:hypothetical protein